MLRGMSGGLADGNYWLVVNGAVFTYVCDCFGRENRARVSVFQVVRMKNLIMLQEGLSVCYWLGDWLTYWMSGCIPD